MFTPPLLFTGLSCDRCNYGFKFLNSTNADGCDPCDCSQDGSLNQFCNPFTGQCECKDGVRGLLCDICAPGSYGLSVGGLCRPCDCNPIGSVLGAACDPLTGQCVCRPHVEGRRCDSCRDGYHSLGVGGSLGCLPCQCEPRGTLELSTCDKMTGQCLCKSGMEGLRCNRCSPHMYWLVSVNSTHGCQPCSCDFLGTVTGTVCDPDSGQCACLPTRHGRDCSTCKPGECFCFHFYLQEIRLFSLFVLLILFFLINLVMSNSTQYHWTTQFHWTTISVLSTNNIE